MIHSLIEADELKEYFRIELDNLLQDVSKENIEDWVMSKMLRNLEDMEYNRREVSKIIEMFLLLKKKLRFSDGTKIFLKHISAFNRISSSSSDDLHSIPSSDSSPSGSNIS